MQIAQQPLQGSLIGYLILPLAKIANKPYPADIPCPCCSRLHQCIVEPNGKENQYFWCLLFPLKCQFHFSFHPITFDSMFREDQQQLVILLYGLVDLSTDLVTCFRIMRSKPAGDAFALQVSVQLLGKGLIFGGIAQNAAMIVRRCVLFLNRSWT